MDPQWVSAVASIVSSAGIVGVLIQLWQTKATFRQLELSVNQLKADHERSRRERALDLLQHWDSSLTLSGAVARKFAESLDFECSKALFLQKPFEVPNRHYGLFVGALSPTTAQLRSENMPDGTFKVSERESAEIRWAVISYLNHLETIFSAVRYNVADKEMIYEQFVYLVSPSDGHYLLENFRKAAGGAKTFPSIEAFANELKERHQRVASGKAPVA